MALSCHVLRIFAIQVRDKEQLDFLFFMSKVTRQVRSKNYMETEAKFREDESAETDSADDAADYCGGSQSDMSGKIGRPTVLVVDDDDVWRMLGREYTEKHLPGVDILEAESAEAAIAVLSKDSKGRVGAVLSDITMPGLSGIELARVLRGETVKGIILKPDIVRRLRDVPVVLHTSCPNHVDPSTPEGARAEELVRRQVVQGVLRKGFPNPQLLSSLARARRGV